MSLPNTVVYGLSVGQFGHGGLYGVAERIPELADLGVDTLWLLPIYPAGTPGYGYDIVDFDAVRPEFGGEQALRAVVESAHRQGMRVLLDFVPAHASIHHPYVQDAMQRPNSPYAALFRWAGQRPHHYFHYTHMASFDLTGQAAQQYLLAVAKRWIQRYDIDGYRVDMAWDVAREAPDYLQHWCEELRRVKPGILLVGESSPFEPRVNDAFDLTYDWDDRFHPQWEGVFESVAGAAGRFHAALTNNGYPPKARLLRFIENNDTGERFITRYGLGCTRLAAALSFAVPGVPLIYTGQEVGAEYQPYGMWGPISFEDPHSLRPYYQKLIALRRRFPSLGSDAMRQLGTSEPASVYAFRRGDDGDVPVIVAANFRPARIGTTVESGSELTGVYVDALDPSYHCEVRQGDLALTLEPHSVRFLVPKGSAA